MQDQRYRVILPRSVAPEVWKRCHYVNHPTVFDITVPLFAASLKESQNKFEILLIAHNYGLAGPSLGGEGRPSTETVFPRTYFISAYLMTSRNGSDSTSIPSDYPAEPPFPPF